MTQPSKPIDVQPIASVEQVRRSLYWIETWAAEERYELATAEEQTLWLGVLESIAGSNAQAGWIAAEALKSRDIEFPRAL